jgi:hypothetical protein
MQSWYIETPTGLFHLMLSYLVGQLKRRHISCENTFFQEPLYEMVVFYRVNADEGNRDMEI